MVKPVLIPKFSNSRIFSEEYQERNSRSTGSSRSNFSPFYKFILSVEPLNILYTYFQRQAYNNYHVLVYSNPLFSISHHHRSSLNIILNLLITLIFISILVFIEILTLSLIYLELFAAMLGSSLILSNSKILNASNL